MVRNYTWKVLGSISLERSTRICLRQWGFSISKSGSSSSRPLLLFFDMCLHWMLNDIHFVQIPAISIPKSPIVLFSVSHRQMEGLLGKKGRGARQIRTELLSFWIKKNKGSLPFLSPTFSAGNFSRVASVSLWMWPFYAMISVTYCRHYRVFLPTGFFLSRVG